MGGVVSSIGNAIGGLLGGGSSQSAAPAPDYAGAAQATATGNLDAARAASAANRVNQYTPYGSLEYRQSGTDQYGNPTWSATTSLSPTGQALLDQQNAAALGLGGTINSALGRVQQTMGQGFNPNTGPITTNAGRANLQTQTDYAGGMQGWDKANQLMMQRLSPLIEQQNEQFDQKMANQGIPVGSKAYQRAALAKNQAQNDLINQSQLAGQQVGQNLFQQGLAGGQFANQAQQQMFNNALANANLGNAAQQQQYNQAMTNYNLPLNTLSALRSGAQVQNPSFVNVPQQATTAGADMLGAAGLTGQYNLGQQNAAAAQNAATTGGLFSLGGAALMSPTGTFSGPNGLFSDIRLKENIKRIGQLPSGLGIYEYDFKPEFKDMAGHGKQIGVMAQEAMAVIPDAVSQHENGYFMVDYSKLQ